jgi:L-lactate dehydrogenase
MKVGVIGMGWVGTSVAMSLLTRGDVRELLVNDLNTARAEGEALDLTHGSPFLRGAAVRATTVEGMRTCDAVVIAAGRNGKPGESRLDLLNDNAAVVRALGAALHGHAGLLVMVTNPVDILTHVLLESSGLPPSRVLGTGTLLDTARMRTQLGCELGVSPQSVHMNVIGEHGDSQVAVFSNARVGNLALRSFPGWQRERERSLAEQVRSAAGQIIARKGATNHAIGLTTAYLLKWALADERRVLTVSRLQEGALGLRDICISLPTIVGRTGGERVLEPELDEEEREALLRSVTVLQTARATLTGPLSLA